MEEKEKEVGAWGGGYGSYRRNALMMMIEADEEIKDLSKVRAVKLGQVSEVIT